MSAHLRYLSYVVRHKWFVLLAGLKTGAPLWRLVIHDWSKFLPSEWFAYARYFYGAEAEGAEAAFDRAWLLHQNRHPHHWQFWVLMEDSPSGGKYALGTPNNVDYSIRTSECIERDAEIWIKGSYDSRGHFQYLTANSLVTDANRYRALPMPEHFIREMVADWMGAGRAITGRWEAREWYEKNKQKQVMHPTTRARVEALLPTNSEVNP